MHVPYHTICIPQPLNPEAVVEVVPKPPRTLPPTCCAPPLQCLLTTRCILVLTRNFLSYKEDHVYKTVKLSFANDQANFFFAAAPSSPPPSTPTTNDNGNSVIIFFKNAKVEAAATAFSDRKRAAAHLRIEDSDHPRYRGHHDRLGPLRDCLHPSEPRRISLEHVGALDNEQREKRKRKHVCITLTSVILPFD